MARFIFLLHEAPTMGDASPAELEAIIKEYMAWSALLREQGRLVGGEKLKDEGGRRVRRGKDAVEVVDGPYAESKDVIGGLYIIAARDYDEAVELARTCPHVKFGEIEVRQIDEL